MTYGPPPRLASGKPRDAAGPRRPFAVAASCALLVALWHLPLAAQDGAGDAGDGSDAVDLEAREAGSGAAPDVVATELVLFAFGAMAADARHAAALDAVAARLADDDSLRVRIDGHSDNVGWALGNQELSRLRARAVARELLARDVAVARLSARAFGESVPAASNATAEGRRRNRRAEILLLR